MSHDIPPAIRRAHKREDANVEVLHTVKEDTTFHRGLGTTGRTVEHVAHECPCCGNDRMIRLRQIYPEDRDGVSYWCLMPNCRYFVADELSWATKPHPEHVPDGPMVWTNTAKCPQCGYRHRVEVERGSPFHDRADAGSSCIIETRCDDCRVGGDGEMAGSVDHTTHERSKQVLPEGEQIPLSETDMLLPGLPGEWSWSTANKYSNGKVNLFFGLNSGEPGGWIGEIDNYHGEDGDEWWSLHVRRIENDGTESGKPEVEPDTVEEFRSLHDAIDFAPDHIAEHYE
jgi:predicted RNA-binding Zn-ribbon protein involved in translation (DUF1610 family)